MMEGASVSVKLATVIANTKAAGEMPTVLSVLLGDTLNKFQLDLTNGSTVLPRQLMLLTLSALDTMRENYVKDEEKKRLAAAAYAAMRAAQKKRPAETTLKQLVEANKD